MPVFSLPGPYGIGDLGPEAHSFIDFLAAARQSCWQILPIGPTNEGLGHSPYMSASALAGNPLLISPDLLVAEGLLRKNEIPPAHFSEFFVEYEQVTAYKNAILDLAWKNFCTIGITQAFDQFLTTHEWAREYALYLAIKNKFAGASWCEWPKALRQRENKALSEAEDELQDEIRRHAFSQFIFCKQWQELHSYAKKQGIALVGDLPIYVAHDSVDVWTNQDIFALDPISGQPIAVAGVPPDYFSATGQRWGNPLYRWNSNDKVVQNQIVDWWEKRFRQNFFYTDTLRIDHFRGFESYWSIPAEEDTAINGSWEPGPGLSFFIAIESRLGHNISVIAEDLGVITPAVSNLRDTLGYPGMKILLFAFDGQPDNGYLPYNCSKDSVMYTGTHDNETAVGWYLNPAVNHAFKRQAKQFANKDNDDAGSFHLDLLYLAMSSPSNLVVFPMQDLLGFGNDCRMNTPGKSEGNWMWRCPLHCVNSGLATGLKECTRFFARDLTRAQKNERSENGNPLA